MSKTYKIALIPGDGTGPEVIAEGVKVKCRSCKNRCKI
jgi:3-isopropylmalate dehydrogenase